MGNASTLESSPPAAQPPPAATRSATQPHDADLAPLRQYWHPVGYSHELVDEPMSVTVLNEPVV